jgi:hypothetical protein
MATIVRKKMHMNKSLNMVIKFANFTINNISTYIQISVIKHIFPAMFSGITINIGYTTSRSFPHSRLITGFVTRLTRRVSLVEQELLILPEHLSSPPVFSGVRVTRPLVLYVCRYSITVNQVMVASVTFSK